MFKLHKQRSDKLGERFDIQFCNLQALQVPKGWDKLSLSIISLETGKTINKLAKVPVWNGNCQWTENISESVWISKHDSSKDSEACLLKFVLTTGSSRSGILGEAIINVANYISSKSSVPVSLQFKKCSQRTTLRMEICCLNPKTKLREEQRDANLLFEEANIDYDDVENDSDVSDNIFVPSTRSSSSTFMESPSHPGELERMETISSPSGSHQSSESLEGSDGRKNYFPSSNPNVDTKNFSGRKDSMGSLMSFTCGSNSLSDPSKSSNSSLNSKVWGSSHSLHKNGEFRRFSLLSSSPLRSSGSSKELIEAVEVTVEELRAEARMWEKNARKLMVDINILQKELLNLSENHESLKLELSESQIECHNLKQEIEFLKTIMEEKQTAMGSFKFQEKDKDNYCKELEKEIQFLKETNSNLTLQLKKAQESNIELVSVLQELEGTIETQKMEIADLLPAKSGVKTSKDVPMEKMRNRLCDTNAEDTMLFLPTTDVLPDFQVCDKKSLNIQQPRFMETQNLETAIKLLQQTSKEKEDEKETEQDHMSEKMIECDAEWWNKSTPKEVEIMSIKESSFAVFDSEELEEVDCEDASNSNLRKEILSLKRKLQELEKDCTELTNENLQLMFKLKELNPKKLSTASSSVSNDSQNIESCHSEISRLNFTVSELSEELKRRENLLEEAFSNQKVCIDLREKCADLESQLHAFRERSCFSDAELSLDCMRTEDKDNEIASLHQQLGCYEEQLQLLLINSKLLQQSCLPRNIFGNYTSDYLEMVKNMYISRANNKDDMMLNKLIRLKELVKLRTNVSGDEQSKEEDSRERISSFDQGEEDQLMVQNLKEDTVSGLDQELSVLHMELESELKILSEQMLEKFYEIDKLKAENLLKNEEVKTLQHRQRELESQILNFEQKKLHEEETVDSGSEGCSVSADKVLLKLSELESDKKELEVHLSELEEENVQLSERICGLEAQLQYLTDDRESSHLALQISESQSAKFQDEMKKLGTEMEAQKVDMKKRLQEMFEKLSEAQEECKNLQIVNTKVQTTAEDLIEECSSLQKSNGELRKQNIKLHEDSALLEAELSESRRVFSFLLKESEVLEEKFTSLLEETAFKEEAINSELNALLLESRELDDRYTQECCISNLMFFKNRQNLMNSKVEISSENAKASEIHSLEKSYSETVVEEKIEQPKKTVDNVHLEYEIKILGLMGELTSSKQNLEVVLAGRENLITLLEDVKSNESKLRSAARSLEMKLKASECERAQLVEEISCLKVQLQKIGLLQNEVLALKRTLKETTFEKERLEVSHHILLVDFEEMKMERESFVQKISSMQNSLLELEDCKSTKFSLQERILRLEGDLTAREALFAQQAELKNELAQIRREHSHLQRRIKRLEEEKEEYQKRAYTVEEQLKHIKEIGHKPGESDVTRDLPDDGSRVLSTPVCHEVKPSLLMIEEQQKQLEVESDQLQHHPGNQGRKDVDEFQENNDRQTKATGDPYDSYLSLRIQFHQNELAEVLEANNMYKSNLNIYLPQTDVMAQMQEHQPRYSHGRTNPRLRWS